MPFDFRPAVRTNSKLLIGLYGQSGSGKTYSSLLLARGLAGDKGKIAMIDTESGRGELYADVIPGGYQVAQIAAPFSPQRYIEAIEAAEAYGADVLIIDSGSHEWEGIGGVIDMAGIVEQRTGKPGLHCWKEPKIQHQKFMLKLLQTPMHVIVCLRSKYKSRQVKDARGKTMIVKDDHTTPIQAEDFIFEATAHAEILADHTIRLTKCSHPQMKACWPTRAPLSIDTGKALAQWSKGGENNGRDSGTPEPENGDTGTLSQALVPPTKTGGEEPIAADEAAGGIGLDGEVALPSAPPVLDDTHPGWATYQEALHIAADEIVPEMDKWLKENRNHVLSLPEPWQDELRELVKKRRNER